MLDSSPPRRSSLGDLFTGLLLPAKALKLTFTTPGILLLSLLCAVVTGACLIGLALTLWGPSSRLVAGWVGGDGGWRGALGTGLAVVVYLALLVASCLTVPPVLLAPLQDPLSEATEARLGDFVAPPFSIARAVTGVRVALTHSALRLGLQLLGYVVLWPLNLIPVAGSVLWAVLSGGWTMWWLSAEHLSGPMARHLMPFSRVLQAMRARPALALGFGASLHVLLIIPVLNFFLVPLAVVGATLYFRLLKSQGNIAV